ncbi:MAG: Fic family protein [Cyanobacteriota bacterium]
MYIYEQKEWPKFTWDNEKILTKLTEVKLSQGLLLGKMQTLGFNLREEATLNALTDDVLKSSEIEGEIFDKEQVRSSIARRLGIDIGGEIPVDRHVEGTVEMMLDATQRYNEPLTKERLIGWHAALFPTGYSGMYKITIGQFRDDKKGPMQVVSGRIGREKVHYQAPPAHKLEEEMNAFLKWVHDENDIDPVIKAGLGHLWFVTLHPFDDGNGRIARALADMLLARAEQSNQRFYSMSAQIRRERNTYYTILEKTQKGSLNITEWLLWFLDCLQRAIQQSDETLGNILKKALFWQKNADLTLNERQKKIINRLFDGFEGKLTSSKWAKIGKCSQDSANRDILDLIEKNVLIKQGAGRSTHYILNTDE